jgi:hypothetical protein
LILFRTQNKFLLLFVNFYSFLTICLIFAFFSYHALYNASSFLFTSSSNFSLLSYILVHILTFHNLFTYKNSLLLFKVLLLFSTSVNLYECGYMAFFLHLLTFFYFIYFMLLFESFCYDSEVFVVFNTLCNLLSLHRSIVPLSYFLLQCVTFNYSFINSSLSQTF